MSFRRFYAVVSYTIPTSFLFYHPKTCAKSVLRNAILMFLIRILSQLCNIKFELTQHNTFKLMSITKNNVYLTELHHDHKEWLIALAFYKDEIKSFENRLGEVATANTHSDVLTEVEHFQNQFFIQRQNISNLEHAIKHDEQLIVDSAKANNIATDHRKIEDNTELRTDIATFEKNFLELKAELVRFLRRVL